MIADAPTKDIVHYGKPAPKIEQLLDLPMEFVSSRAGTFCYRSKKTVGSCLRQLWVIEASIVGDVAVLWKTEETLGALIAKSIRVAVEAQLTGLFWPSFSYMDCLPCFIYYKGYPPDKREEKYNASL